MVIFIFFMQEGVIRIFYSIVNKNVKGIIDAAIVYNPILVQKLQKSSRAIIDHVYFHCIVYALQEKYGDDLSISQYHSNKMKDLSSDASMDEVDEAENQYERLVDYYNTLNHHNKDKLEERRKQEKQKGKSARYKGIELKSYQIPEFESLVKIKGDNSKEKTYYKRIMSDKGYIYLTKYKDIQRFNQQLLHDIDESEDSNPNIRYYKLEKALNFELFKSILKKLNACKGEVNFDKDSFLHDLLMVTQSPLLSYRHQYIDNYPFHHEVDVKVWKRELSVTNEILAQSIVAIQTAIDRSGVDILERVSWDRFKSIYLPGTYQRDYKLRKDFNADDFNTLMNYIDKQNANLRKQK
ncbi:hypothetical protein J5S49_04885 [Virgibacillus halodenitrificans]|uniref:hypothetical protein n=1 Tax=Virgibacillus halodenitrificans TaxID=1482 RepID=UPI001F3EF481|nr:hypothetical protein [Virgibacillus halodenitrificans]MCG1027617.1 hypothetical protein [Virgibacillus halodenitrificans]